MWGGGGRFYWRRKEEGAAGIVVIFAVLSSNDHNLEPYVDLYSSLGWSSLVCHSDFLTLFFPEKATSLASGVLNELVKEMRIRPLPIIFAAFSGGPKGCMYKVIQLMEGTCKGQDILDVPHLVREHFCGQIYDSGPLDFTSDLGAQFILHPTVNKLPLPPRLVSWTGKALASGLDTLFLNRFEEQRAEYWQTLHSSVGFGPFLILCSEDDGLAPYSVICSFAQRLQELGGDVKVMKWRNSPHVGHYKHHTVEYKDTVTELLHKAANIYSERRLKGEAMGTESSHKISKSVWDLHKAAVSSNESLKRVATRPSDHFFLPSSVNYDGTKDDFPIEDNHKEGLAHLQSPSINANGVLSQILYDVCVPKNVEGWDIKPVASLNGRQSLISARRHGPLNPFRFIRRSRL